MSDISPEAAARRDAARVHGRFGEQDRSEPEIHLVTLTTPEQSTADVLARKAASTIEPAQTRALEPGDVVLTETNTDHSPFAFALNRSRDLRRRWAAAAYPQSLTVLSRRRAPEDGHTDDEVTFDLGGEPLVLTFHREASFRQVR